MLRGGAGSGREFGMGIQSDEFEDERETELRRQQRAQRYARARREKERQLRMRRRMRVCLTGALCLAAAIGAAAVFRKAAGGKGGEAGTEEVQTENGAAEDNMAGVTGYDLADITGYAVAEGAGDPDGSERMESAGTAGEENGAGAGGASGSGQDSVSASSEQGGMLQVGDTEFLAGFTAQETEDTHGVDPEQVTSIYALLIDESTNEIVAEQNAHEIINPASMTKILTVLVAAERVKDLDEKVAVTIEATDYAFSHDCSTAGFAADEQVPVRDLFYGTVLPSGADAAVALAIHTAGSQEAFVELMNEKLDELGLSATAHFTNCVGLYDEAHHCTVYDMAMILKAAVENDFCREVLSAHTYTTAQTEAHPEGILLSNWFLRRIEDKDTGGEVLCAKTGFVNQSGNCAASYQITDSGRPYICVTADAHSSWRCIYDHVAMYSLYAE